MGVAGGGKADDALSDPTIAGTAPRIAGTAPRIAGTAPRTDGGAKPIPERELTIVPLEGTPFEGTGERPCSCGVTSDGETAAESGVCFSICDLTVTCEPAADGSTPR